MQQDSPEDMTNDPLRVLEALDLPPQSISAFLAHIEQFCHTHGGERHYRDLLSLVKKYRQAQE